MGSLYEGSWFLVRVSINWVSFCGCPYSKNPTRSPTIVGLCWAPQQQQHTSALCATDSDPFRLGDWQLRRPFALAWAVAEVEVSHTQKYTLPGIWRQKEIARTLWNCRCLFLGTTAAAFIAVLLLPAADLGTPPAPLVQIIVHGVRGRGPCVVLDGTLPHTIYKQLASQVKPPCPRRLLA